MLLVALVAAGTVQLVRPTPPPRLAPVLASAYTVPGLPLSLPWPAAGQASMLLQGTGWVGRTARQTPIAIASVTKLMTALVVLGGHPLALGQSGPAVTITAADLQLYQQEVAQGDSVVKVAEGESLTEYQLLEGLLLPSADNFARLLAAWDAGSLTAFVERMNETAGRLGMSHTHFADASGLNPGTVSTASDLVRLAGAVMAKPVLAQIVGMSAAVLPLAGTVHNYDFVLGQQGVVGIKTGWTAAAGGCFVFAARRTVAGHSAQLLGAVLAQPGNAYTGIEAAEKASVALLAATWTHLEVVEPVRSGAWVAELLSDWQRPIWVRAASGVSALGWPGLSLSLSLAQLGRLAAPLPSGSILAEITMSYGGAVVNRSRATLSGALNPPDPAWRLTHF